MYEIAIPDVILWAEASEHKWWRLIGNAFVHKSHGSIILEAVDYPYLTFGNHEFTIRDPEKKFIPFFRCALISSKTLTNEIVTFPEELKNRAEIQRQKIAEDNRRIKIKEEITKLLSEANFEAATTQYNIQCKEWWDQDDFLSEAEKFIKRQLDAQRVETKNKVIALLLNGEIDAAERMYETRCKEWWSGSAFACEKKKAEERRSKQKIIAWCREHQLAEGEIITLIEIDKRRAHNFARMLLKIKNGLASIIPNVELKWAVDCGATDTVLRYVEGRLFRSTAALIFEKSTNCHVNYSRELNRAALHRYLRIEGKTERNEDTHRIWNFKNGRTEEVRHYTNLLDEILASNLIVCCAPSSGRGDWGPGLLRATETLGNHQNRKAIPRLLRRTEDTAPRSQGGNRSKELNLKTIEVTDVDSIKDKPVVIIDDVTTTGQTLTACSELLWNAGVNCVGAVALALTTNITSEQAVSHDVVSHSELDDEVPF